MFKHAVFKIARALVIPMALCLAPIPTAAQIDNCCFVDRQCTTNYDWVSGYYAYQNNQCGAPQQQQQQQLSQSQAASSEINNCCFTGWQCDTDEEWRGGYFAFQQNQCAGSQSDWQAQWQRQQYGGPQRSAANRPPIAGVQPRSDGNQQGHFSSQPRQFGYQQQQEQAPERESVLIDTNQEVGTKIRTETEAGTPVVIIRLSREEFCKIAWYVPDCW